MATESVSLSQNGLLKWCNSKIPYSMLITKKSIIYLKGCRKLKIIGKGQNMQCPQTCVQRKGKERKHDGV